MAANDYIFLGYGADTRDPVYYPFTANPWDVWLTRHGVTRGPQDSTKERTRMAQLLVGTDPVTGYQAHYDCYLCGNTYTGDGVEINGRLVCPPCINNATIALYPQEV